MKKVLLAMLIMLLIGSAWSFGGAKGETGDSIPLPKQLRLGHSP
jgi:hypothetical protein